ncbi:class I SAM-dependent methyltransferase [Aestuariirhabdus sp. Z084]|uniref:class I SAM-dependent methyltransferase n=1 Tax=Aestuariirhabdus haliotis TaxID=2918751 RepID=UPI00201B4107|nr:class I SAM-dependent methyltransferase [Aestuariirhabdus haliotis]MCL6416213.1 class I SAM-dependent methyltransferase [Aestuariirhabdus haliotis]MCL6420265.1 class I SAM-dependent methyltransferase [Aestuariirhabdus haliotis]
MTEQEQYIQALIELHCGLERQGPGDTVFSLKLLSQLPSLPSRPRIADIGCGAGVAALMLAEHFQVPVKAVDFSRAFLDELMTRAQARGIGHLIEAVECDMGSLDWAPHSLDLLWSEGAAYNLTFAGALKAWRPLMAPQGIAVISEMNYFSKTVPEPVSDFWRAGYPAMGTEASNAELALVAGFEVLSIQRLPSQAWWNNYYGPLQKKMRSIKAGAGELLARVIEETEQEMALFEAYSDHYGYSFYTLKAI